MEGLVRVPVREQEPKVRATNFEEVCYGYNEEEAVAEASEEAVIWNSAVDTRVFLILSWLSSH